MNGELEDPFERAAQREHAVRSFTRVTADWRRRRLTTRLKWLAFLVLTLPFVLLIADWNVSTIVVVWLGLTTFAAVLVAWSWIDERRDPRKERPGTS